VWFDAQCLYATCIDDVIYTEKGVPACTLPPSRQHNALSHALASSSLVSTSQPTFLSFSTFSFVGISDGFHLHTSRGGASASTQFPSGSDRLCSCAFSSWLSSRSSRSGPNGVNCRPGWWQRKSCRGTHTACDAHTSHRFRTMEKCSWLAVSSTCGTITTATWQASLFLSLGTISLAEVHGLFCQC
jgi:hypothetical protein